MKRRLEENCVISGRPQGCAAGTGWGRSVLKSQRGGSEQKNTILSNTLWEMRWVGQEGRPWQWRTVCHINVCVCVCCACMCVCICVCLCVSAHEGLVRLPNQTLYSWDVKSVEETGRVGGASHLWKVGCWATCYCHSKSLQEPTVWKSYWSMYWS